MKITSFNFFRLMGRTEPAYQDYERVGRPLDVYEEFDSIGPWDMVDKQTGMIHVANTFLEIKTDEGVSGIYGPLVFDNMIPIIKGMGSFLTGKDPLATELIWDQLRRGDRHGRTGLYIMALSAVDCALWDIKGKYYKQPVFKLLGGPTRKEVKTYVSTLGLSLDIDLAVEKAKELKELGYKAQKWFFRYGPNAGSEGMNKNIELAYALRSALGKDYGLMFDCWMGWDLGYSINMFRELEAVNPEWIEEPLMPNDLEGYVKLADKVAIPIATGEHLYTRWELKAFLDSGAISIIQPDPSWTGGITELKKMGDLTELYSIKMIPHGCTVPAAVHVVAALTPAVSPCAEYLVSYQERQQLFQKHPLKPAGGTIALPSEPGLGLSFDEDRIENMEVI